MKKPILRLIVSILTLALIAIPSVMAHCPLCTTGAVVGVGAARYLGVDDSIVGLLIGAVIVSSVLWFNKWLKKKVNFPMQEMAIMLITFLSVAIPFYFAGIITNFEMVKSMPEHHSILGLGIYGIDKILFGMILGTLLIWFVFGLSDYIREKRGKVLFPYQGISFMVIALAISSLILWLITK